MAVIRVEECAGMGVKRVIKKGLFSGLNPMRWIGYEQIANNGRVIKQMVDRVMLPPKVTASTPVTFEACMHRYGLSESDLQRRMKISFRIALLCLLFSAPMAIYTIYLFVHALWLGALVSVMLTLLLWAYAFREHFNYFQMKQRRLGCTLKEWFFTTFFKAKKQ